MSPAYWYWMVVVNVWWFMHYLVLCMYGYVGGELTKNAICKNRFSFFMISVILEFILDVTRWMLYLV